MSNSEYLTEAEISQQAAFVKAHKTNTEYNKVIFIESEKKNIEVDPHLYSDPFASFGKETIEIYKHTLISDTTNIASAVSFINPAFDTYFKLIPGQLMALCAYTGSGKSTSCVHVAAEYIRNGKRPYIISNEETAKNFYEMIACSLLSLHYYKYVNNQLTEDETTAVQNRVQQFIDKKEVFVLDEQLSKGGTAKAEAILSMLEVWNSASIKPDIVMIDYLTHISVAGSNSMENHYFQLSFFLGQLKATVNKVSFPIILAAQLYSNDKRKGSSLDAKLVMGSDILRIATIAVELSKDPETHKSTFKVHKNRKFNKYGEVHLCIDKATAQFREWNTSDAFKIPTSLASMLSKEDQ